MVATVDGGGRTRRRYTPSEPEREDHRGTKEESSLWTGKQGGEGFTGTGSPSPLPPGSGSGNSH